MSPAESPESPESVDPGRRLLLTRGAALAGAAAGAVAIGVAGARPAAAANGDAVTVGGNFTGTTRTGLTSTNDGQAALQLTNSGGAALQITQRARFSETDTLPVGAFSADPTGPVVGVGDGNGGSYAGGVAVLSDLDTLPLPFAAPPERRVDTRYPSSRTNILDTSGLDSSGRLRGGQFIDVVVDTASTEYTLQGVFLNITSLGSTAGGFITAYPPFSSPGGTRPNSSNLNYAKGATIANFCLAAVDLAEDNFLVRIYSSSTTHVIVDLNGVVATSIPSASNQRRAAQRAVKRSAARRPRSVSAARRR